MTTIIGITFAAIAVVFSNEHNAINRTAWFVLGLYGASLLTPVSP